MTVLDLKPWAYVSVLGHFLISATTGLIVYHMVNWFSKNNIKYGHENKIRSFALNFAFLSSILMHLIVDLFHYI